MERKFLHHPNYLYLTAVAIVDDPDGKYHKHDEFPIEHISFKENGDIEIVNHVLEYLDVTDNDSCIDIPYENFEFYNGTTNKKLDDIKTLKTYNDDIVFMYPEPISSYYDVNSNVFIEYVFYKEIHLGRISVAKHIYKNKKPEIHSTIIKGGANLFFNALKLEIDKYKNESDEEV